MGRQKSPVILRDFFFTTFQNFTFLNYCYLPPAAEGLRPWIPRLPARREGFTKRCKVNLHAPTRYYEFETVIVLRFTSWNVITLDTHAIV